MIVRAGTLLLIALALTPAALTAGRSWLASGDAVTRPVTLQGPITDFRQGADQIEVRLDASLARQATGTMRLSIVDVSNPDAEPLTLSLRRGQTFANAKLPEHLAEAPMLSVTVEPVQTLAQN